MDRQELMHHAIMTFRKADNMLRRYLDHRLSHTGVFPTQHRLLMELGHNPNCSQTVLAEKFEVSAAAIAVSLKKLENGGYITRLADKMDNRINQVSMTEKGRTIVDQSVRIFQETDRQVFDGFSDEEVEQFLFYMERMYANLASGEREESRTHRKEEEPRL